jgi:hypothetical protein
MAYAEAIAAVAISNVSTGAGGPGFTTLDGVSLTGLPAPVRILLTAQTLAKHNGVWIWAGASTQLVRPGGQDQYASGNSLDNSTLIPVTSGTVYGGSVWGLDPSQVVTVDTTPHTLTRAVLPPVQAVAASIGSNVNLSPGSAMTSLDGVTFSSASNGAQGSDVILLKDQSTPSESVNEFETPRGEVY